MGPLPVAQLATAMTLERPLKTRREVAELVKHFASRETKIKENTLQELLGSLSDTS